MHSLRKSDYFYIQIKTLNMIQRIQTVYLLLTTILAVLFLTGTIMLFSSNAGNDLMIRLTGVYAIGGVSGMEKIDSLIFLTTILLIIPAISLITIFMFKNRKLQMKFNLTLILLILIQIFLAAFQVFNISMDFNVTLSPGLKLLLPLLMLISSALSYRSIKKDEKVIMSYDRLR
jgi:hypothetical protein